MYSLHALDFKYVNHLLYMEGKVANILFMML